MVASSSLETGRLAKQAHGSVLAQYGETVVLATVVSAYSSREKVDFLPLTVDYVEKTFAAGKIPGGFFKREGRPSEKEILTSRLIDRSMRPLFPKGYDRETQVLSRCSRRTARTIPTCSSLIAASTALEVSDIPHDGPVAAVRMGRIDGQTGGQSAAQRHGEQRYLDGGRGQAGHDRDAGRRARISSTKRRCSKRCSWRMRRCRRFSRCSSELRRMAGKPKRDFKPKELDPDDTRGGADARSRDSLEVALAITGKKERSRRAV